MNDKNIEIDVPNLVSYWKSEAEEALVVADHLMEKKDFSYALFFGHLAIEKILKSLYIKMHKKHAPPLHNLVRLAHLNQIQLTEKQTYDLVEISTFNIESRYPDDKRTFRKLCTEGYTQPKMNMIKENFSWLKSLLK